MILNQNNLHPNQRYKTNYLRPFQFVLLICLVIFFAACKSNKNAVEGRPASGSSDIDPSDAKPKVDTRFQENFFAAQLEKSKDNLDKAYKLFEECLIIDPKNAAVHFELGRMDLQVRNNPNAALAHAKMALVGDNKNPWYHSLLADTYMALAKYDLATKEYREVSKLNRNDANILYQIATAQLYDDKVNEAIDTYNELEKQAGPYEELSMQKHQLYLKMNEPIKAGLEIEKLARAYPEDPSYWGIAAQFYATVNMLEKSKQAMEEMVKIDPNNGLVHFQLSEYYAATGEDEKSYEELNKAFATTDISIDQKIGVLLKYFSLTDFNQTYLPQAYQLLILTEQVHPKEAKAYSIYGDFLYREGRDLEAIQKYRIAAELDPTRKAIWEQIVSLDNELEDYPNMALESKKAIDFFPNIPEFFYFNGFANTQLKNHAQAVESLNIGKELVVENDALLVRFFALLGEAYHYQNAFEKSNIAYEKVLQLQPDNVFVLNNYAYYLSIRKVKLEHAAGMALKANTLQPDNATFEDTYAWILFQQNKYNEALVWIEKALSHDTETGELLEHHGDILFKLNRNTEALQKWNAAKQFGGASNKIDQKINEQKYVE